MKKVLYLGTDPKEFEFNATDCRVTHYPVIQIQPRLLDEKEKREVLADLDQCTHFIFTSKNAVSIFFDYLKMKVGLRPCVAVGAVTAFHLKQRGVLNLLVAEEETQEGIVALLKTLDLKNSYLFIPKSSLSRPFLEDFLRKEKIPYRACVIYDTVTQVLDYKPSLEEYDLVVFTSPSTVEAFISIFGSLPSDEKCCSIGPVTTQALTRKRSFLSSEKINTPFGASLPVIELHR